MDIKPNSCYRANGSKPSSGQLQPFDLRARSAQSRDGVAEGRFQGGNKRRATLIFLILTIWKI